MKILLALLLLIPNLLYAKTNLIFCTSDREDISYYFKETRYYEIDDRSKKISLIKQHQGTSDYSEFLFKETEKWDIWFNLEIEITSFDETHISFQEKFTTYESKRNAVDLIEIDRIGGIMSLYSFIFIDENGELYSEEGKNEANAKRYYLKDESYKFFDNASLNKYTCEKSKNL